jgi:hypothetical protein
MSPRSTFRQCAAGVFVLLVLGLGWATPGWAPNCPSGCRPTLTNIHLVLDDILALPLTGGQTDTVPLTGDVHVVAHATPATGGTFDVRLLVNLHGVRGVGELTGVSYIAVGAARFEGQGVAPSTHHEVIGAFALETLHPPDPAVPPDPVLLLRIQLSLQADGTVLEPTIAIEPPSVDLP